VGEQGQQQESQRPQEDTLRIPCLPLTPTAKVEAFCQGPVKHAWSLINSFTLATNFTHPLSLWSDLLHFAKTLCKMGGEDLKYRMILIFTQGFCLNAIFSQYIGMLESMYFIIIIIFFDRETRVS
jgi:hypothetical protein